MPAKIIQGDLLSQPVEVSVNAWNRNVIPWWLLLPQGVSGAIKRKAGYQPFRELSRVGWIPAGDARLTSAGRLPFKAIIHVAGINLAWRSSLKIVDRCVLNALALAGEHQFSSIAMPLIGSGTGGLSVAAAKSCILDAADRSDYRGEVIIVEFSGRK